MRKVNQSNKYQVDFKFSKKMKHNENRVFVNRRILIAVQNKSVLRKKLKDMKFLITM